MKITTNPTNHGQSTPKPNLHLRYNLFPVNKQNRRLEGSKPLSLQADLLVKRISEGNFSSQYLADAFLSVYTKQPFNESLRGLTKLDNEAIRLLQQIVQIRLQFVSSWQEKILYKVELKIREILTEQSRTLSTKGAM